MRTDEFTDLLGIAASQGPDADVARGREGVDRRIRRHRARRLGGISIVLALMIGAGWLLADSGGRNEVFVGGEVPRLVPDPVPAGLVPESVVDLPGDTTTVGTDVGMPTRTWLWRPVGASDWTRGLKLQVVAVDEVTGPLEGTGSSATEGVFTSAWRAEGDVILSAVGRGVPQADTQTLLDAVRLSPTGELTGAVAPDGWESVVDDVPYDVVNEGLAGGEAHSAIWSDATTNRERMLLVLTASGPHVAAAMEITAFGLDGTASQVTIAGRAATLFHMDGQSALNAQGPASTFQSVPVLIWLQDGVLHRVQAWGYSDDEALSIAASLRPATDAEWAAMKLESSTVVNDRTGGETCVTTSDGSVECSFEAVGEPIDPSSGGSASTAP